MKKVGLVLFLIVIALVGAAVVSWMTATEEDYRKVAIGIFERELARAGVRSDAFESLGAERHGGSLMYMWVSKASPSAYVSVGMDLIFDRYLIGDNFSGSPMIPNCYDRREETIRVFGGVCL